jgi:hypothetical protein
MAGVLAAAVAGGDAAQALKASTTMLANARDRWVFGIMMVLFLATLAAATQT